MAKVMKVRVVTYNEEFLAPELRNTEYTQYYLNNEKAQYDSNKYQLRSASAFLQITQDELNALEYNQEYNF